MTQHVQHTRRPAVATPGEPVPWWKTAVIYQIYPRSFADSDGNGIGDLEGIRDRSADDRAGTIFDGLIIAEQGLLLSPAGEERSGDRTGARSRDLTC